MLSLTDRCLEACVVLTIQSTSTQGCYAVQSFIRPSYYIPVCLNKVLETHN